MNLVSPPSSAPAFSLFSPYFVYFTVVDTAMLSMMYHRNVDGGTVSIMLRW